MCREHIESFMRGVNQYTNESQLSQRVGEWQTRLAPVLEEQAQRRTFDIREYGHEIMGEVGEQMDSAKASNRAATKSRASGAPGRERDSARRRHRGKPAYDVCRIFLASLQLANEGNLLLHHPENSGDVCGLNDLRVEVLSDVMSEERFDTTSLRPWPPRGQVKIAKQEEGRFRGGEFWGWVGCSLEGGGVGLHVLCVACLKAGPGLGY